MKDFLNPSQGMREESLTYVMLLNLYVIFSQKLFQMALI